jgi:hypothetical protein
MIPWSLFSCIPGRPPREQNNKHPIHYFPMQIFSMPPPRLPRLPPLSASSQTCPAKPMCTLSKSEIGSRDAVCLDTRRSELRALRPLWFSVCGRWKRRSSRHKRASDDVSPFPYLQYASPAVRHRSQLGLTAIKVCKIPHCTGVRAHSQVNREAQILTRQNVLRNGR